ncbi:MAG TPA: CocE/NonD family hydrolase, partial [Dongiaceae bacterium]|nr:CocE/NonD family hydrolase [Dongiaceae bacterium]
MKLLAIIAAAIGTVFAAASVPPTVPSPFPAATPGARVEVTRHSLYLRMRDGVRLAVELLRAPSTNAGARMPAIVRFTRYGRTGGRDAVSPTDAFWVNRGYVVVAVDQRGTGASFGRVHYGRAELDDMRTVLDWVVAQPWSNGRVGAIGTSYEGTTAELLAATGHPAVRAVAPLYSDYDYYDLFRPGGVFNEGLATGFARILAAMDAGEVAVPVEGDAGRAQMQVALADHRANPDLAVALRSGEFDDDVVTGDLGGSPRDLAPAGSREALARARVPELHVTSWYDAAVAQGVLQRYADVAVRQRVVIGVTNHGGSRLADPFRAPGPNPDGNLSQQYRLAAA